MKRRSKVSFQVSLKDAALIDLVVDRAWAIDWLRGSYPARLDMRMDVAATHANGNPLRLEDLLHADDFNFAHDMSGICNCLDRETGKLTRGFSPRFTRHKAA